MRAPKDLTPAVACLASLAIIAGCGTKGSASSSTPGRANPKTTAKRSPIERRVPLKVVKRGDGSTVAVVPVFIAGRGLFPFILDTGATQTLIDTGLVHRLKIPLQGKQRGISGVTGPATGAAKVGIKDWKAGTVTLPPQAVLTVSTPIGRALKQAQGGNATFGGLLGADILSTFGIVAIDFQRHELVLHSPR
jgi:hypothetical protein